MIGNLVDTLKFFLLKFYCFVSDDNVMLHRGEPLMTYDALLLYADEDQDIVDDMRARLHPSLRVGDKCVSLPYNKSSKILL